MRTTAICSTHQRGIFDAEFRYRVPQTGSNLRGEYVRVDFGSSGNLRANNDTDPTNNVGKSMFGYSGEVAYHVPSRYRPEQRLGGRAFYRYTYENLRPADLPAPM